MFEKRTDLVRFLAVAETGRIGAAAERTNVTQPTLTRDVARLERRLGGRLFERIPTGMRLTALGAIAAERARRILLEVEAAEQAMDAAHAGRTGVIRITATPPWAETVLAPAASGTMRGPRLPSRSRNSPVVRSTSSQRRVRISDLRQPVSTTSRIAAIAEGHIEPSASASLRAAPTFRYSSGVRKRSRDCSR